jgi:hypothetical protein
MTDLRTETEKKQSFLQRRYEELVNQVTEVYKTGQGLHTNWDSNSPEWERYEQEVGPVFGRICNELYNLRLAMKGIFSQTKEAPKTIERR